MRVLVLAAGEGERLLPRTAGRPKALVEVAGKPLIDRILDAFVEGGAREFVVVLGRRGDQLRDHLARRSDAGIRFVRNTEAGSGSARSLLHGVAALARHVQGPFLLCMGDHLLSRDIVTRALATDGNENCVFVDSQPPPGIESEATLVRLADDGTVLAIGKGLPQWDAVDIGLFRLRTDALGHLARLPASAQLNDAWQTLVGERRLRSIDVSGAWWADIDTEADLAEAEAALGPT